MLSTLFIRIYALWCSFIQKTWILFGSMYFFAEIFPLYFVLLLFWMSCPHGALARQGKQGSHIDYEAAAGPRISLCQVDFYRTFLCKACVIGNNLLSRFVLLGQPLYFQICSVLPCTRNGVYTFTRYEVECIKRGIQ